MDFLINFVTRCIIGGDPDYGDTYNKLVNSLNKSIDDNNIIYILISV